MTDEAREQGFAACKDGWSINDNPYDPLGTDKEYEDWGEWEDGFLAYLDMFN